MLDKTVLLGAAVTLALCTATRILTDASSRVDCRYRESLVASIGGESLCDVARREIAAAQTPRLHPQLLFTQGPLRTETSLQ